MVLDMNWLQLNSKKLETWVVTTKHHLTLAVARPTYVEQFCFQTQTVVQDS